MAKITLDIEGNFTALEKAGEDIDHLNDEAGHAANSMSKAFKSANESAEKFDNSIKKTNEDLNKLGKEIEKNNKFSNAFKEQSNKVNELKESYKNLAIAGRENGKVARGVKEEYEKLERELDDVIGKMKIVKGESESMSSKFNTIATGFVMGSVISKGLSEISEAFTHAIDIQRQFEASLKNLQAITGASAEDIQFYSDKALELGIRVKGGASAAVEAFKLIGGAKPELLANKDALVEVTEAAILLSQASGLELPEAATRLTDAMNQFGAASDQAGKFVDTLAAGAKFGAAEVPQITDALLKFGVAAKSSNISLNESVAAIELLGEKGLKGAEAGTALRNVFAKLSATKILPKEAKKELEDAGVNLKVLSDTTIPLQQRLQELSKIQNNANALTRVFGLENKNAAQSILQNLPRLEELNKQIGEQGLGSALEQATINTDTLDQALLEAGNTYDNMLLSITSGDFGEIIKGFVKSSTDELKQFSTTLGDVGTLLTKGFDALGEKGVDRKFAEIASNISKDKRRLVAQELADQIRNINIQIQNNKNLTDDQKQKYQDQLIAKAKLANAILALDKKQSVASKEAIVTAEQETTDETGAELKKRLKLNEDYQNALNDLLKRQAKAEIEGLTGEAKVNALRKEAQLEIDIVKENLLKKKVEAGKGNKLSKQEADAFRAIELEADRQQAEALLKILIDKSNAIAQQRKKDADNEVAFVELKNKLAIAEINGATNDAGLTKPDFELAKQRVLLQQEIAFTKELQDVKQAQLNADTQAQINANEKEIERLKQFADEQSRIKIEGLEKDNDSLRENVVIQSDIINQESSNLIEALRKKIEELDKERNKFSLAKLLGISDGDLEMVKTAINEVGKALDKAFELQIQSVDRELEINKKKIDASQELIDQREKERDDLEDKLKDEQKLQDDGLANNLNLIQSQLDANQKQIDSEKQQKDKALEEEKRLQAEKQKLQKEQLILDTIVQGSNLITAATNIYVATSKLGPIGVAAGTIAIAAMIAGFVFEKAAAFNAVNKPAFKDGVIDLQGPGTATSDSIDAKLSAGESVMTAEETDRYKNLFLAIRSKSEPLLQDELLELLAGTGVTINKDLPKELSNKKDYIKNVETKLLFHRDNSGVEKRLDKVEGVLQGIKKQGEVKITTLQNGDILIQKGNSKRTIIKK